MDKLDLLRSLRFGERVAEDELDILAYYFVETDHWRRVFSGEVDVIYGPKGSGKSAIYSLLCARAGELFDRSIILATGENPRGTPAFRDLEIDPPVSEREFVGMWKLYFAALIYGVFDEYGFKGDNVKRLGEALAGEGLIRGKLSLQALLRAVSDYARWVSRPRAVEAGVEVNSITGNPVFKGKIDLSEPNAQQAKTGVLSVDNLLLLANNALADNLGFTVWILLDRLDVAFAENAILEQNALRALFRAYLDLLSLQYIRIKIFLRTDIWNRLTSGGFREASHITRHMTIDWNKTSLLNLVVRRALYNGSLCDYYSVAPPDVLKTITSQESFFYKVCPSQVEVGSNKPATFEWILGRTKDGAGKNAPREVIDLLNCVKAVQIRRMEIAEAAQDNGTLFERASFKLAMPEVSKTKLVQTLYAEYPSLRDYLEKLRNQKTQHTNKSLSTIWGTSTDETARIANELVDAGFFEKSGARDDPQYKVPFIYRYALTLVQGSAD